VLLDNLPGESAYKTAVRDDLTDEQLTAVGGQPRRGHGPWSNTDLLLASAIDHLKWVIYAVYAAQGGKPKQPQPTPRPGVAPKRRALSAEGSAYLRRLREEHARIHGYDPDDTGLPKTLPETLPETG